MSKASESVRRWLDRGAYGERIEDTRELLKERDILLSALAVFVKKYNSAPDGVLGIGLVNSDFFAASDAYMLTVKDDCKCSDGPFHYSGCPMYDENAINPFSKLGEEMSRSSKAKRE
ncbi:MAG TPA: hypothetical protein VFM18_20690 [Methanosarcina sp.]|nr:hypothetical protein [Methanosarcina sp.]